MSSTVATASVPLHFQCPISLDLMTDPVTLCTGITYDRAGIEKWLRGGRNTCPVTRQELWSVELIPNHTLHRIIQSWCGATSSAAEKTDSGANREQMDSEQVNRLLQDIKSGKLRVDALKKLRALAREKQTKRRAAAFGGASTVLASLLSLYSEKVENSHEILDSCEEIITTLCLLDLTDDAVVLLGDQKTLSCLGWFLRRGSFIVKNDAAYLMGRIATSQRHLLRHLGALPGVLKGLLQLLEDDTSRLASEYNLEVLLVLCSCRRNTIRSIEAGAVSVVVELLSQAQGSCCEKALALLQLILSCAEGRAAAAQHATLVSTIGKKLLRVSDTATELAVGALWELCEYSADSRVRYETLKAGVFPKLVLLLQIGCTRRTREKAWELIRLLNIVRGESSSLSSR